MSRSFFRGLLAGLVGGVAAALILWGAWMLPALGLLLTQADIYRGIVAVLALGTLGGGVYGLLMARRITLWGSLLGGLVLGAALWAGGVLLLVPWLLGLPLRITSPGDHLLSLAAFLVHGVITALLHGRWYGRHRRARFYTALVLVVLAALSAPLLLRGAFSTSPRYLSLPEGYQAQVLVRGLTYATCIALDEDGELYIAESGFSYGPKTALARIFHLDGGSLREVARDFQGPINGLAVREKNASGAIKSTASACRRHHHAPRPGDWGAEHICRRPAQPLWHCFLPPRPPLRHQPGLRRPGAAGGGQLPRLDSGSKRGRLVRLARLAGTVPLSDQRFSSRRGDNRNPLIANQPAVEPPLAELPPYWSPMKLAFLDGSTLLVAIFGDGQPLTEDIDQPAATGIIHVDTGDGSYSWFARNDGFPRAGRLGRGWKRVIDVAVGADGSIYILDFGLLEFTDIAPNAIPGSGVLWQLTPTGSANR